MKISHIIRPYRIRLYKLTLVKQGTHMDFNNIHTLFKVKQQGKGRRVP